MTTVYADVRVLVVGPSDLLTTAVAAALGNNGLDVQASRVADVPPAAPGASGVAVVTVPARPGLVGDAVRSGWRVLALFEPGDVRNAASAVADGAAAIFPRSAPLDELLRVVTRLTAGTGMSPDERQAYLRLHRSLKIRALAGRHRLDALTDRELEVLQRLERGQRAADIAQDAVVAMSTVRTHIRSILEKLEVHSQHQAVEAYREARRHG